MPETVTTTTPKASKNVKLNPPKPFTGKQSGFILFMQDVFVYLKVNKLIYDDDEKKISLILSYLADGDAQTSQVGEITKILLRPSRKCSNHMMNRQKPLRI
jgi:hypothetical protein